MFIAMTSDPSLHPPRVEGINSVQRRTTTEKARLVDSRDQSTSTCLKGHFIRTNSNTGTGATSSFRAPGRRRDRKSRDPKGRVADVSASGRNGAAGVAADPRFGEIASDFAFSSHNLPGVPFGELRLKMPALLASGQRNLRPTTISACDLHPRRDGLSRIRPRAGSCGCLGDVAHPARRAHGKPVRRRRRAGQQDRRRVSPFRPVESSRQFQLTSTSMQKTRHSAGS